MNNYIYIINNKWTQYKIKCLNKKMPTLTAEFEALKIIENWTNTLILDLNDEINNYSYYLQLTALTDIFFPKIIEDFIALKMKKDTFYSILNKKYLKKIEMLKLYINNKIEKKNFSKKHLEKILTKVLKFRSYFNNKLLVIENNLLIINSKIKVLNKEIFARQIKFLQKQQLQLQQKNNSIEQQKIKLKNSIKSINIKLEQQLNLDYKNNKLTNFNFFLEIPRKANLKIIAFAKQIANLEIKQSKIYQQIQTLQQKNNELTFNQKNINNQTINIEYKQELSNKTLVNNLTMSLRTYIATRNFN
ncbi:hypothetical protein [Spiroplasma endosymbiont of Polydrusus pterygomalis]|uniref:hypothetical protein n=1 Tax=Spiroplasma endosymbiont of Polydrusus pterygomalis TaxID=3139327 RepID=UPI003CCB00AC